MGSAIVSADPPAVPSEAVGPIQAFSAHPVSDGGPNLFALVEGSSPTGHTTQTMAARSSDPTCILLALAMAGPRAFDANNWKFFFTVTADGGGGYAWHDLDAQILDANGSPVAHLARQTVGARVVNGVISMPISLPQFSLDEGEALYLTFAMEHDQSEGVVEVTFDQVQVTA